MAGHLVDLADLAADALTASLGHPGDTLWDTLWESGAEWAMQSRERPAAPTTTAGRHGCTAESSNTENVQLEIN